LTVVKKTHLTGSSSTNTKILMENTAPTTDTTPQPEAPAKLPFDVWKFIEYLWQRRKLIVLVIGIGTFLSAGISFLQTKQYVSTTVLLPGIDNQSGASVLGGLSGFASMAGLTPAKYEDLFKDMINSESVLRRVIYARYLTEEFKDSVNLIQYWDISKKTTTLDLEVALKSLRASLDVQMETKTKIVRVAVTTDDAGLSAQIANMIVNSLDIFIRSVRTSKASEQRIFIEKRLEEVKKDLEKSENDLKDFRVTNRRVGDSPDLLLMQERLLREVQINATLFTELKKQYEIAKIEEIKNLTLVQVMDKARAAGMSTSTRKYIIVLGCFSLLTVVSFIFLYALFAYSSELRTIFLRLRGLFLVKPI
jgi:uncharacterized protein involved in exopolysaccharide biosynthesis